MNEHITYANEIKEKEREQERILYRQNDRHRRERMDGDASPSMISDKLILEMSCQCVNIVQGDVNTVFSHLATLVHSKSARKDSRGDRTFMLSPSWRIPRLWGLRKFWEDN